MTLSVRIGTRKKIIPCRDFAHASELYSAARDASGSGASRFPEGAVLDGGREVARISYNGRVWEPGPWTADSVLLHDNRNQHA